MINAIINRPNGKWLEGSGPFREIVISSRVRLARNLVEVPFPPQMNEEQAQELVNAVGKILTEPEVCQEIGCLQVVHLNELSALDRQILVEKHLISPNHAASNARGRGLGIREDESIAVMINEEDHLRIQCFYSGLQVREAWQMADQLDNLLEAKLNYAFDEKFGYLTVCPTNVGTGMRASVMLHLPALVMINQVQRVLSTLSQIGLAVRGLYGEGTQASGNLYQVSNQVTLGSQEEEIVNNLNGVTEHIVEQEKNAREHLMRNARLQLEDRIGRAWGILTNARIMTSEHALTYLSDVRLGVDLGILKNQEMRTLNELLVLTQPGFLQKQTGQEMNAAARDIKRAAIIRDKFQEGNQ